MLLQIIRRHKVETYFFAATISSVLTAGYLLAQIAAVLIINAFLLSRRMFAIMSVIIISFMIFINYTALITGTKNAGKERSTYETTRGTVLADNYLKLKAGEAVIGKYGRIPYKGFEGRLAAGYLELQEVYFRINIPMLSTIMSKREDLSKRMFQDSAGRLRIVQALMIGDTSYVSGKIQDEYLVTGLTHLLSVSGTHVGVITLICFTLLFFLPLKIRLMAACIALMAFIPLAGFKVPVMRSAFSGIVVMIAYILDCKTDLRKLVLFLWSFFILISPYLIVNLSFLLSFIAIYGIVSIDFKGLGWFEGAVKTGIVATAFTMPLCLYVFGTFNPASILNTVVMVPVAYFQIIGGFVFMISPSIAIEPLVFLENLNMLLSDYLTKVTGIFFVLKHINVYVFTALMFFLAIISRTKHAIVSGLIFLTVFIPSKVEDGLYFPELGRYRAFIYKEGDRYEAFYSGFRSSYIYSFVPFAAKFGVTNFDYADINVYDSENIIFKNLEPNGSFSRICVNILDCEKPLIYMTRSNTIKKSNINPDKVYFVLKNKFKAENIIELYENTPLHYLPLNEEQ